MIKTKLFMVIIALLLFSSCRTAIKPDDLYGKWRYLKVENTNGADSVRHSELEIEKPYIEFSKNDSMHIWWGGKVLSHGTFKVEGSNIRVKEILADGKTRDFPFWVSKLTDKDLVFESNGEDGSRVTAVKEQ
jgi:hypothetical protein